MFSGASHDSKFLLRVSPPSPPLDGTAQQLLILSVPRLKMPLLMTIIWLVFVTILHIPPCHSESYFINPPRAGSMKDYHNNPAYEVGSGIVIEWKTDIVVKLKLAITLDNQPHDSNGGFMKELIRKWASHYLTTYIHIDSCPFDETGLRVGSFNFTRLT